MFLLFDLEYLLAMQEIPSLNPFSMNMHMFQVHVNVHKQVHLNAHNLTLVIFNIESQLNPGELKYWQGSSP